VQARIADSTSRFEVLQRPAFNVWGDSAVFANMADWNPAEIIGIRPKPLALSLYSYLICDSVWAQQRAEYGYRDLSGCKLLKIFGGQPYVDARASLNSFIPADLPDQTVERLANAYLSILIENPLLQDKVEFDVAFTAWTPDFLPRATDRLLKYGVKFSDLEILEKSLKAITVSGFIRLENDISLISDLESKRRAVLDSNLSELDKIVALLNDCRRLGTLPFAHAARAGFLAATMLASFVNCGIMTERRRLSFLRSFTTVASDLIADKLSFKKGMLSSQDLVERYGHLRPGTYEVSVPAYWENPESYLLNKSDHYCPVN